MENKKTEELWDKYRTMSYKYGELMDKDNFVKAVSQVEYEIYHEVIDNLRQINMSSGIEEYIQEIRDKIRNLPEKDTSLKAIDTIEFTLPVTNIPQMKLTELKETMDRMVKKTMKVHIDAHAKEVAVDLLKLIYKYDCRPSEITELIKINDPNPNPLSVGWWENGRIVDIKIKRKDESNGD